MPPPPAPPPPLEALPYWYAVKAEIYSSHVAEHQLADHYTTLNDQFGTHQDACNSSGTQAEGQPTCQKQKALAKPQG